MNKVILTAPNGKVYITKTKYDINDSFYSLAPSIKDSNRFFKEKDLKFIKETLMPKGRVTAIDGMQFIAQGSRIYTIPMDGRTTEAKKLSYFAWDNAYQFIKDNKDTPDIPTYPYGRIIFNLNKSDEIFTEEDYQEITAKGFKCNLINL